MNAEDAREFFRSHVADYDATHYGDGVRSFMTVRQRRMLEMVDGLGLPKGARILDAGCGPGHLLRALAERGFDAWGLDASGAMVAASRERLEKAGMPSVGRVLMGGIEELPFADVSFDLVCSAGVIEYLAGDGPVLAEFWRILKPGGRLLLPTTNGWSFVGWLDFAVEALKRREWVLRSVNRWLARRGAPPIRSRVFPLRKHRPSLLRKALAGAGFELRDHLYFYFLPWPHPFDRLFPKASAFLGAPMERLARSPLGPSGEGYLTLSVRRPRPAATSSTIS
jgi:ubiquinone/menaquinone biosynthesis C-methylase UbiE